MGARNVSAVFALWPTLPPLPKVLLLGMALQSLDAPSADGRPARVFFGGQDTLVEFTGRSRSSTYDALKTLRDRGAVKVLDAGRNGHRAVYKLALDALAEGSGFLDPSTSTETDPGSEIPDPKGSRFPDGRVQVSGRKGPDSRTPRNHEEDKESREEEHHLSAPPHLRVVGGTANDEEMTYGQAYKALVQQLGAGPASEAVALLVVEQGMSNEAAVIHLAKTLRDTA